MESVKVKFDVVSGVEGPSLYMDCYRIAGNKPWGGGKILNTFSVDRNELIDKILQCDSADKITKQHFAKNEHGEYTYQFEDPSGTIYITICKKTPKSKLWVIEFNANKMFIFKTCKSLNACIDEIPFFIGIMK